MLRSYSRLFQRYPTIFTLTRLPTARLQTCHFSISSTCPTEGLRDFGLPNATWGPNLRNLYDKFLDLTNTGLWRRIPSHNTTVNHLEGIGKRMFLRNIDEDGVGFEYCMFYNKAESRMVCLFQPGPYLEGPPGYAHGGSIATIIDSTAGAGAVYTCGSVMTANLNINYLKPIPLGCTLLVDSYVEKIEGRKVYSRCHIQSHDALILHTEAMALYIKLG
uniref:Acyl-coenzyme A thioesterase THEM4 n=2 Tax=Pyxicephalus adspersus TaxID=30357 RepID=A0AAV2ZNU0_PYXAD|nr:TPA: hypothetical protein GDO54_005183 [Pyxicephalus adspersus]